SARTKWLAGIVGNRVVVADDARGVERLGRLARNHFLVGQINQNEMVVGTSRHQREPPRQQFLRQCLRIANYLGRVLFELRGGRFFQCSANGGGGVVVRTALQARKSRTIDGIRHFRTAEDHRPPRPTQRLVGGGRYHIGIGNRVGVFSAHNQTGDV